METNKTTQSLKSLKLVEIMVTATTVSCDGGERDGHPRVFLDLSKTGRVECPYCSRVYVLKK
jgi:uncharacterized Zn-finger protein